MGVVQGLSGWLLLWLKKVLACLNGVASARELQRRDSPFSTVYHFLSDPFLYASLRGREHHSTPITHTFSESQEHVLSVPEVWYMCSNAFIVKSCLKDVATL